MSVNKIAGIHKISDKIFLNSPDSSQLPNCKKVLASRPELTFLSDSDTILEKKKKETITVPTDGWNVTTPFEAKISSAKWLTSDSNIIEDINSWGETKRVIHLEVDLENSGIEYQPGDSIGICCPNPKALVNLVYERLKSKSAEIQNDKNWSLDSYVSLKSNGENSCCSIQELLEYR